MDYYHFSKSNPTVILGQYFYSEVYTYLEVAKRVDLSSPHKKNFNCVVMDVN